MLLSDVGGLVNWGGMKARTGAFFCTMMKVFFSGFKPEEEQVGSGGGGGGGGGGGDVLVGVIVIDGVTTVDVLMAVHTETILGSITGSGCLVAVDAVVVISVF